MKINKYLPLSLGALTVIAAYVHGASAVLPQTAVAVATACLLDVTLRRTITGVRAFPHAALVSGFIVALLLTEGQPLYVPLAAATVAIAAKHLLRWHGRNVFNPAAAGIAVVVLVFAGPLELGHADYLGGAPRLHYAEDYLRMDGWSFVVQDGHGWLASTSALAVVALGAILVLRLRRRELVTAYLVTYVALVAAFAVIAGHDLGTRLLIEMFPTGIPFFALFMLTDPATSPATARGRIGYGAGTAALSFLCRLIFSPVLFLVLALLAANAALQLTRPRRRQDLPTRTRQGAPSG